MFRWKATACEFYLTDISSSFSLTKQFKANQSLRVTVLPCLIYLSGFNNERDVLAYLSHLLKASAIKVAMAVKFLLTNLLVTFQQGTKDKIISRFTSMQEPVKIFFFFFLSLSIPRLLLFCFLCFAPLQNFKGSYTENDTHLFSHAQRTLEIRVTLDHISANLNNLS